MKKIKTYFLSATVILAVLTVSLFFAAEGAAASYPATRELITEYDVDIQISRDSSMLVTENITANVRNIDIKKGIIRVFPVKYTDKHGRTMRVGFDVLNVKINGRTQGGRLPTTAAIPNCASATPTLL